MDNINKIFGADLTALRSGTPAGKAMAEALSRIVSHDYAPSEDGVEAEDRQTIS